MGQVPEGPREFFRLSPAERGAFGGFAVRRGQTLQRFDPAFHLTPDAGEALGARGASHPLGSIWEVIDSGRPILERVDLDGIPAYEVGHILPGSLKDTLIRVNPVTDRLLLKGDILTGRVGALGAFAVYDSEEPASFSDNTLRIRLLAEHCHRAHFVCAFLNSASGNSQVLRGSRGSLQKVVTQGSLATVVIPFLGNAESALSRELERARAARDSHLAAAEAVVDGLDTFILAELGLALPPGHDGSPFAVSRATLRAGGKMFPNYFNPDRRRAVTELRRAGADVLDNLVEFVRDQRIISPDDTTYVGLANVRANTGEFVEAEEEVGGMVSTFAKGDVLFAKLRPYLNKVWVADREGVCSPEFHVLRLLPDGPVASPDYLAAVLRASPTLAQTVRMMTGNTHPRLAPEDVVELVVPVPSAAKQASIAAEVDRRRAEARRLRAEAREGWARARQAFENALLSPAQ